MKSKLTIEIESQEVLDRLRKIKGITVTSIQNSVPVNIQEIIDEIIENFNFNNVHDVMKYTNWTWYEKVIVPPIEELKNKASDLLQEAYNGYFERGNGENYCVATGGFEASYMYDDNKDCFELKFVLESVNNYY